MKTLLIAACIILLCGAAATPEVTMKQVTMNTIAEAYVKLALELDQYDPGYVDAYYGPADWKPTTKVSKSDPIPTLRLRERCDALLSRLEQMTPDALRGLHKMRWDYLHTHLRAARGRIELLGGAKMTFDEESKALYDVIAPAHADVNRDSLLAELDRLVPDTGLLAVRLDRFLKRFYIPKEKVAAVYDAALAEARRRTREKVALPNDESLRLEYVTNKPWGAYNWFKGHSQSLVQVNLDQQVTIGGALGTVVHEGYPGHHTNLTLMEKHLYRDSGWVEYSVVPLYCPMSVISEGIANYAYDMLFPNHEGEEFEKKVLFKIAGLDTTDADLGYRIGKIRRELGKCEIEIARAYLDGTMTASQTESTLVALSINTPTDVARKISFFDAYRAYIVCYSVGKDLVRKSVESVPEADRWTRFNEILSTPVVPSSL